MNERTSKSVGKTLEAWRTSEDVRSRWKPKPVRLCFSFELQEQSVLKRTHMSHTESDLDVLYMDGKIISRSFQWNQFQAQIDLESSGIVCTS
jgi:hypothetical protein